jgi:hypothetical protein
MNKCWLFVNLHLLLSPTQAKHKFQTSKRALSVCSHRKASTMKACAIFVNLIVNLIMLTAAFGQSQPDRLPHPRIGKLTVDSVNVTVLHLRSGYVSSVRLPEEVSSVVIGDPKSFRAEHSDAEPRLVFLKPLTAKPSETNALITTKSGHEVPLHLVSSGKPDSGDVDFFLDYERPHSFIIPPVASSLVVGESQNLSGSDPEAADSRSKEPPASIARELRRQAMVAAPEWKGKQLEVAVGDARQDGEQMTVAFSVLNNTSGTIELLPPQVQLSGSAKQQRGTRTKAEPIAVADYRLTARSMAPGTRADGVVCFERPSFKESSEQLLLQVAQAAQVDQPILVPIPFTAPTKKEAQ